MNRRNIIYLAIAVAVVLIGAVIYFKTSRTTDRASSGVYAYENKDLGFKLSLPAEFQYFQTQRKEGAGFKEIEIFVPTSDQRYSQEVPGYAKPLTVRVYDKDAYKEEDGFGRIEEKGLKVYAVKFWENEPSDWRGKWTEALQQQIINSIKMD